MKFNQKFDHNLKLFHMTNEDLQDDWQYPRQNLERNIRNFDKSPNFEIFKQHNDYTLSSMWPGVDENNHFNKNNKRNFGNFNGHNGYYEEQPEKKLKINESFDYEAGFIKSPLNCNYNRNKIGQTQENQEFPEKIQFNLFKKPMPMYYKKPNLHEKYTLIKKEPYESKIKKYNENIFYFLYILENLNII